MWCRLFDTFSSVVKPATVRVVILLAISFGWDLAMRFSMVNEEVYRQDLWMLHVNLHELGLVI